MRRKGKGRRKEEEDKEKELISMTAGMLRQFKDP